MLRNQHILVFFCSVLSVAMWGCDLPGLNFGTQREPSPETNNGENPDGVVCEANSRQCRTAYSVQVCSADGTDYDVKTCEAGEACTAGRCVALEGSCKPGQEYALSSTHLIYDVTSDNKTQIQEVTIENCGTGVVVLEEVEVRDGPTRPDGEPVFVLASQTSSHVRLSAGQSATIRVMYQPAAGVEQAAGYVKLGIIAGGYQRLTIPVSTRVHCVSALPYLNFEVLEAGESRTLWLQNCGTEDVEVADVSSRGVDFEPIEKLPYRLRPGRHLGVIVLPELGKLSDRITFDLTDQTNVSTAVLGHVVRAQDCDSSLIPAPLQVAKGNDAPVDAAIVDVVSTKETIRILPEDVAPGVEPVYEVVTPARSETITNLGAAGMLFPKSTGTLVIDHRVVGADHRISCEATSTTLNVGPEDGLWVELTWENIGDLIPGDLGFGRGVNLDLHVVADRERNGFKSSADCHPGVESCMDGKGFVVAKSLSGHAPEVVHFPVTEGTYDIGVYLSNAFNFGGANARVKVFWNGTLVDERTALITGANDFWLIGSVDSDSDGFWTSFDSVFSGFPYQ